MKNKMGCLYKTIRLYRVITKKEIHDKARLSRQYLSTLEDSTEYFSISRNTNEKLQKIYQFTLDQDPQLLNQFTTLRKKFIQACLYLEINHANDAMNQLYSMANRIEKTIYFPEYLLLRFVEVVFLEKKDSEFEHISFVLDKIKNHFETKTKQLYYLTMGIYAFDCRDYVQAENYLYEAQNLNSDAHLQSMIVYYLGKLALCRDNSLESLSLIMRARELFDNTCNYRRSVECISHYGLIWMHVGEYHGAIEYCNNAIEAAKRIDYPKLIGLNYRYLVWIYLQNKEYENSLEYATKATHIGENDPMMCFHACFSAWKLEDYVQMNRWINSGLIHSNKTYYLSRRLLTLMKKMERNTDSLETILLTMIQMIDQTKDKDQELLKLLYHELAMLYKDRQDYEPALNYYEKYYKIKY